MRIQDLDHPVSSHIDRRADILAAADGHFRLYGYDRTTVADIARAVGFSTAYVYRFFESKQAIGEAVCRLCLAGLDAELGRIVASGLSPSLVITNIFHTLAAYARDLALRECKLKDMVVAAHDGRWQAFQDHDARLEMLIVKTVEEGRRLGEFERVTPLAETCRAVLLVLEPFRNPADWSEKADELTEQASSLAALVLRSLAVST